MNKIGEIQNIYNKNQAYLNNLAKGIDNDGEERKILDKFLDSIGVEKNKETRYAGYLRLSGLKEDNLKVYLEKIHTKDTVEEILRKSYIYTQYFHSKIMNNILNKINEENLLSDFYKELVKGFMESGKYFSKLFIEWQKYLVNGIIPDIQKEIGQDTGVVMKYMEDNNLFDKGHLEDIADRSYSVLKKTNNGYIKLAYCDAFPTQVNNIINSLNDLVKNLEKNEDNQYNSKESYIEYITAIINAFSEKNTDKLVEKWAEVDRKWMKVTGPIQLVHPLEFYEDPYRKAVSIEWDLRFVDENILKSEIKNDMKNMFEHIYSMINNDEKYEKIYKVSLSALERTQLYISNPIFYAGSQLNGLFSAQVVPNDEIVSNELGKKIFAFPSMVLQSQKTKPKTLLTQKTISSNLLKISKNILSNETLYYKIYDTTTIGHEFGHTLWEDTDTGTVMNSTGNFKNIEEWKATAGGLVAWFLSDKNQDIKKELLTEHIDRCIRIIKWMKVPDVLPYYTESLIHLKLLFDSGMIYVGEDKKIEMNFNYTTFSKLKELYIDTYKDIANHYLNKKDASDFLFKYVIKQGDVFLPKDDKIRNFVKKFHDLYKEIGNQVI